MNTAGPSSGPAFSLSGRWAAVPAQAVQGELRREEKSMPNPDDRHVLAAAIRAGADVIVTYNLTDFPAETLARFDIEALHPDDFPVRLKGGSPVAG
jgi:hypothetical protein